MESQVVSALLSLRDAVHGLRDTLNTARGNTVSAMAAAKQSPKDRGLQRAAVAAARAETVAQRQYDAEIANQARQQSMFRQQQQLAARMDGTVTALDLARTKLADLRSSRSQMASGIAGTVGGFDSGILGHQDTRNTPQRVLQGLKYDRAQVIAFQKQTAALQKAGLSKDLVNQIASAGVDGGGATARALQGSSRAQIHAINATVGSTNRYAAQLGGQVGGQFYDVGIAAAQGIVAGLQSKQGGMQKVMDRFAASMVGGLKRALGIKSPSRVFHELGRHTGTGFEHGIKSKFAAVNAAVSNMVDIPSMAGGRGGGAGPISGAGGDLNDQVRGRAQQRAAQPRAANSTVTVLMALAINATAY